MDAPIVPLVIQQHLDESVELFNVRIALTRAPHIGLRHLRRWDDRLSVNLEGLSIAGDRGISVSRRSFAALGAGEVFVALVGAVEGRRVDVIEKVLTIAETSPELHVGFNFALQWLSSSSFASARERLVRTCTRFGRATEIWALYLHQLDPGELLDKSLDDRDAYLRARALRLVGMCGRRDLRDVCVTAARSTDPVMRLWGSYSSVLLADRSAIDILGRFEPSDSLSSEYLFPLAMKAFAPSDAAATLRVLAEDQHTRLVIRLTGHAGDPRYIPWLISQMSDPILSRLAGESFSTITGADLSWLDLDRKPPEAVEIGPDDDPDDDNVAMDEDEGLPWPDPAKVQAWWSANAYRFQPGVRYFMGAPPSWEHCLQVLRSGYQRQRMAAAEYLCLLRPGTMLFNCEAPAWRQQRWLEQMQ